MTELMVFVMSVVLAATVTVLALHDTGDAYFEAAIAAKATRELQNGRSIMDAVRLWKAYNEGNFPDGTAEGKDPLQLIVEGGYLTRVPDGLTEKWQVDAINRAALSTIGSVGEEEPLKICVDMRTRMRMSSPEIIYKCDGSDAPGGALETNDPCCIE